MANLSDDISITVEKCGIRIKSPALVLFYKLKTGKLRRRTMPIRRLLKKASVKSVVDDLKERHSSYLESIPDIRLQKLVRIIQECQSGRTVNDSLNIVEKEFSIDPNEDLNKLDDCTVSRKKELMNETFEKNQKKPGDSNFVYDIEVEFDNDNVIETCGWDSDDKEDDSF
ncbi:CEP19 (predicted) [Pycnogonum litorale]